MRAGVRAAIASRTSVSVILPWPTSRRTATIRRTIPRRKALARTSIVPSRPFLPIRTACTFRTGERTFGPKPIVGFVRLAENPAYDKHHLVAKSVDRLERAKALGRLSCFTDA